MKKDKYSENYKNTQQHSINFKLFTFIGIISTIIFARFVLIPIGLLSTNKSLLIFILVGSVVVLVIGLVFATKKV